MNEEQAKQHEKRMKEVLEEFNDNLREQAGWDPDDRTAYREYVEAVRNLVAAIIDPVKEARIDRILDSVTDTAGHHLRRGFDRAQTKATGVEVEEEDVEEPEEAQARVTENKRMTRATANSIGEVFRAAAEVHAKQHVVATMLADLATEMNPQDYLEVVKAVGKPSITMRFPEHLMPTPVTPTEEEQDVDKRAERIRRQMISNNLPDPNAPSLKGETKESPTRILAAIIYYELGKRYAGRTTQVGVATKFRITMTDMKKGITGKKYKGGEGKKKKKESKPEEATGTLPDIPIATTSGLVVTQRPGRASKDKGEAKRRASQPPDPKEQEDQPLYVPDDDDDDDDDEQDPPPQPPKKRPKLSKGKGKKQ